jgi:hypothetical protein
MSLTWTGKTKVYVISYDSRDDFPITGIIDTIYIDDSTNELYRWTGSSYVVIGEYPSVPTYADLPSAALNNGKIYLVTTATGIYPFNYKPAGFYISNGITWTQIPTTVETTPGGPASGDLADTYPNPTVAKVNGSLLGTTSIADTYILMGNGTDISSIALAGDVKINTGGITAIGLNKVTDGMLRKSAALSVLGNATNGLLDVADITAASDFQVLRRSGTALAFGSINLASSNAVTGILPNDNTTAEEYTGANTPLSIASRNSFGELIADFAGSATNANAVAISPDTTDTVANILFVNTVGPNFQTPRTNSGLLYNAVTNALTATSFIGTATIASTVSTANEATDTTCFPLFVTASGTQTLQPKNNANLTFDSSAGQLGVSSMLLGSGNSALRFTNSIQSRKIELYRDVDNDHQYSGFGVNSFTLRYQVGGSSVDHIFYSAINSTSSLELFRIKGDGVINIPGLTVSSLVYTNGIKDLASVTIGAGLTLTSGTLASTSSGNVGSGTANQLAYYSAAGTTIAGTSFFKDYGSANPTTTGGNLFIGTGCGSASITDNDSNTGIGVNCLASISTSVVAGGGNTSVGCNSLFGLTSGLYNTSMGSGAGYFSTTGSNNSLFGQQAGGQRVSYSNCSFFGFAADASVSGLSNAMALGYQASESESNSITLGNTSVTKVKTSGNLLLNTTTASAKLVVNGGVQNIGGEDSCIRVISSSNNAKIELECTSASGRLWEIRSNSNANFDITDRSGAATRFVIDSGGNVMIGGTIATNATNGFLKIPTCAGTPTGIPAQGNGCMVMDTTNNRLYIWSSSAWRPAM